MRIPGKQRLSLNVLAIIVSAIPDWKFGPDKRERKLCGAANAIRESNLPVIHQAGKGELWWVQWL